MAKQRPRQSLSDQLRAAIAASGRSEYDLSTAAVVDQGSVTRFMRGERSWTLETADRLAEVLGLELAPGRARPQLVARARFRTDRRPSPAGSPASPPEPSSEFGQDPEPQP
jgi:hypothetical protein